MKKNLYNAVYNEFNKVFGNSQKIEVTFKTKVKEKIIRQARNIKSDLTE